MEAASVPIGEPTEAPQPPDIGALARAAGRGVLWRSCAKVGAQGLDALAKLILARLLAPRHFGLVGMATIVTGLVGVFSELGLSAAIVQRKDLEERHRSSGFWLNIATGVVLCGVGFALAPLATRYFREPGVAAIVQVLSVTFVISSTAIVQASLLQRALRFRDLAVRDLLGVIAGGATAIVLALLGFGVWALVWGSVAGLTVSTIALWLIGDWCPRLYFDRGSAGELFNFGGKVLGTQLVNYAIRNFDYFVIGRVLGAGALGLYTLAYKMLLLPLDQVTRVVCAVLFPALSQVQRHDSLVNRAYLKAVGYIAALTLPVEAGIFAVAPEAVRSLLGAKWEGAILPMRIFCLTAALQSIGAPVWTAVDAKGRPDLSLKWTCGFVGFQIAAILLGVRYEIVGVAVGITGLSVLAFPVAQRIGFRVTGTRWGEFWSAVAPSALGAGIMLASLLTLKQCVAPSVVGGIPRLAMLVVVGVAVYAGYARLSTKHPAREMLELLRSLRHAPPGSTEVAPEEAKGGGAN